MITLALKPIDIVNKKFGRKVRGYDTSEVDEFLRSAADDMEEILAANAELRVRVQSLDGDLQRYRDMESALNNAFILAQKTAEDTTAAAHKEADLIVREARDDIKAESQQALRELEDLRKTKERFGIEFRALLRSCLEMCERSEGVGRSDQPAE